MKMKSTAAFCLLLSALSRHAAATSLALTIAPKAGGSGIEFTQLQGIDLTDAAAGRASAFIQDFPASLTVNCSQNVDCTGVSLSLNRSPVAVQQRTAQQVRAVIAAISGASPATLEISFRGSGGLADQALAIGLQWIVPAGATEGSGAAPTYATTSQPMNLTDLLQASCPAAAIEQEPATFVVTPLGNVLVPPAGQITIKSKVKVRVYGDSRLLPLLVLERKSSLRTVGAMTILGAGLTVSVPRSVAEAGTVSRCDLSQPYIFTDLAPGTADLALSAYTNSGKVPLATIDFVVADLYYGMFSMGAISSSLRDKSFALTPQGGSNIILATSDGSRETLFTVMYTPFVWGPRNIEKPPSEIYKHINPVFGITLTNTAENAIAGLAADWSGILLTGGIHFGRVQDLNPKSGLHEGSAFAGTADQIPTQKRWEHGAFFGIQIDLRAAAGLLKIVSTSGGA